MQLTGDEKTPPVVLQSPRIRTKQIVPPQGGPPVEVFTVS